MFDIEYRGGNGLIISTKNTKLAVDPRLSVVGLKDLNVKDAVQLATESRFLLEDSDSRLDIEGPGEYEVGDFSIRGIATSRHIDADSSLKSTVYRVNAGDVRIAIFGNISGSLNDDQLEAIGVVDIVVVPIGGGGYTLDSVGAAKLVRQIDPKVVIPVHYADKALSYEVPQDPIDLFVKELGAPVETVDKYKLKTATAIPASLTVIEVSRT